MKLIGGHTIICLLLLLSFHLSYYGTAGDQVSISEEEFEKQLKILNKPPIKTIKGKAGDLFDCVDIHRQPALDHPLLQNHKVQMRPTTSPQDLREGHETTLPSSARKHPSVTLEGGGCPQGTVPIRRTTKQDLMRAKAFFDLKGSIHPSTVSSPGEHIAVVRTRNHPMKTYYGVQGDINLQNPRVPSNQSSSAAYIYIENAAKREIIIAGWMVAPSLFGDAQTRLVTYWTAGDSGCCNLLCPGFVQVDPNYPIGGVISPISKYGGPQYHIPLFIYKDKGTMNWWLATSDLTIKYGYWPNSLIPGLGMGSHIVGWAGATRAPLKELSPEMGSGYFPDGHYDHSANFRFMKVVNGSSLLTEPDPDFIEQYVDRPKCYGVVYLGYQFPATGHTMMFGGPGGQCGD